MKTNEYEKFDKTMKQLMKVPHSEIKRKMEQEKKERKKIKKSSASGHA
jgi:hypothetical protein